MWDLMNQHVRFIEPGKSFFREMRKNFDPKPALGSSEDRLIERIQMSTKTTYKRIALVAVAALGFGLLSVAPSSATTQSDTLALGATATSVTTGTAATTSLTQTFLGLAGDTMTVTVSLVSGPTGNTTVPTLAVNAGTSTGGLPTLASSLVGQMMDTAGGGASFALANAVYVLSLPSTAIPGTYVIKATPSNGVPSAAVSSTNPTGQATSAAAVTWTVTVGAVATAASADATSTSIIVAGNVTVGSADALVNAAPTSGIVATIKVTPLVASAAATGSSAITVVITGPGTLSTPQSSATFLSGALTGLKTVTLTGAAGPFWISVYGDGTSGTSTITSTIGSVVLTETINTYGAAASAVATVVKPVVAVGSTASAGAITVLVKDANGNVVPSATVFARSGTETVFASGTAVTASTGIASFNLTALTAGTSSFTFANVAAGSTAVYTSAAVSVRAGSDGASSVTMTLDKASYVPGEAATLTVMIKDAAGNPVADGTYAAFAAQVVSSRALTSGTLPAASLATGSSTGTLKYAINVPNTFGDFTISALGGAGLAAAQAGLAISASATITISAAEAAAAEAIAAAADAAAEATDAANAATDAANAAAEAADAATAAAQDAADGVAALSVQVGELVAGLAAQITAQKAAIRALTNLVIKIQKALAKAAKKKKKK